MAKEPRSLHGSVVAITGAARGIGKATAAALAAEGARVGIGDLDGELARTTADQLGGRAVGIDLNVADRASFASFLDRVEAELGPIDVLVNNAGIMPLGSFIEEDDATAARQIDINLHGVLFGMKLALPRMRARGKGHIVNIASTAGKSGFPGGATYCATKHAVVGVSEAVRAELRGTGIEVSVVMPGVVNTELASGLHKARAVKSVEPEDVAAAIVDALKLPRFDVFVPRSIGPILTGISLLPRRGRDAVARLLKADKVLAQADSRSRAAYEDRAAHSEPGREPERGESATAVRPAAGDASAPAEEAQAAS